MSEAQIAGRQCTVATCALTIRTRGFTVLLVHGDNQRTERIGYLGGAVKRAVVGVPDAMDEARIGHRQSVASVALVASMFVGVAILGRGIDRSQPLKATVSGLVLAGGGSYLSIWQRRRARQSLERAVWLFNRSLRP
jgi:hypothetical protein